MQTALGVLTALLVAGAVYMQPAHAQVQIQPPPGFSVQVGPQVPPPPELQREEWREREAFTVRDEKKDGNNDGKRSGEHASTAIGS